MLKTSLSNCKSFLFDQLLKNWAQHGIDSEYGFSYESMNHDWSPKKLNRLRLLTQCRQLYTFSHAYQIEEKEEWKAKLQPLFDFITNYYYQDNRWIFSLNDDLSIKDEQSDAYALAFVLLSFSHYYQVTQDKRALSYVKETHRFLMDNMQAKSGGFYEAFPIDDNQVRRQNPHMHLLEGYIAAFNTTQNKEYKKVIESLLTLALEQFYDKKTKTLREFFSSDWQLDSKTGHHVEPGHHFEWVWLLYQVNKILPNTDYTDLAQHLWSTATRHGFTKNGGIYDQIDGNSYLPLDKEKRIWPITEYLKAITAIPIGKEEKNHRIEDALNFMEEYYFLDNGRWNEYLDEHNKAKDFPLPGTSSYHIFLGLAEVLKWSK